jgi:hypothetical protein
MKIIEVKKRKEPYKLNNGGTKYSAWCVIDDNGKELQASVCCYTEKIKLEAGAEYTGDRVKSKIVNYEKNGEQKSFTEYTIYAEKTMNFQKKTYVTYTQHEFFTLWQYCKTQTKSDTELDTLFRCATVSGIKIDPKDIPQKEIVKDNIDVPFEPPKDNFKEATDAALKQDDLDDDDVPF